MTLQEEVELLNVHRRLRSAAEVTHHFKINESSKRTTVKREKETREAVAAATPCTFCEIPFYLIMKMQLLCGCRISVINAYL